jgi:hypothetical protein
MIVAILAAFEDERGAASGPPPSSSEANRYQLPVQPA